jgi:hypothetical protein
MSNVKTPKINDVANKIREVDERLVTMKQEREVQQTFNNICNLRELVNTSYKNLKDDISLCEKIEIINDLRKNLPTHMSSLNVKLNYEYSKNYRQNYSVRNTDGYRPDKSENSLGRNINNNSNVPSLWVSGFSNTTGQRDLHTLFQHLDNRLTLELVVHRGHYAFINFRDPNAAENAHSRCWNLNGEIL